MNWMIDKGKPICPQLAGQISAAIVSGFYSPNEKLKSVREIALEAGINPNTVQRSFELLESEGVVYSVRGTGWFVSENAENALRLREALVKEKLKEFFDHMRLLGFTGEQTKKTVEDYEYE